MPRPRGKSHSTLTETAELVVKELRGLSGIKMIAPGEIRSNSRGSSGRFITIVYTNAGCELIISGQSTQKIAVHGEQLERIAPFLSSLKRLQQFNIKERERKPGI